ncbi:MAG: hypothetical protein BGO44_10380 [Legionella sp. 39-23]|nr:MAG: hypothetical protein BGO44_10380 [Legionella sp. 39-23]
MLISYLGQPFNHKALFLPRKEVPNQYSLFMWYAILSKIFFLQLTPEWLKLLTERPMGATTLAGANGAASTDIMESMLLKLLRL